MFGRTDATWSLRAELSPSDGHQTELFGQSVAFSGDTVLVGAPLDGGTEVGSSYVFDLGTVAPPGTDQTPPVTTSALAPAANAAGWNKTAVTLTLAAADNAGGSGVDKTYYRFGTSGDFTVYSADAKPKVSAEGSTKVEYYSTDLAGNAEMAKSVTVKIDTNKPTATALRSVSVVKGRTAALPYQVGDSLPGCGKAKVTIAIKRGTKTVTTMRLANVPTNKARSYSFRVHASQGSLRLDREGH